MCRRSSTIRRQGQLTASDVRKIVDASAGQQLTAGDVQTIVQQSTGQQLTAADVQKIVDASASGQLTTADVQRIISASVSEAVEAANQATEAAMMAQKAAMEAGEKAQLALARLPELTTVGAQEGFSRVTLPTLEPPPPGSIMSNLTLVRLTGAPVPLPVWAQGRGYASVQRGWRWTGPTTGGSSCRRSTSPP